MRIISPIRAGRAPLADALEQVNSGGNGIHGFTHTHDRPPATTMTPDFFRTLEATRTRALVERDMVTIERLHAPEYELVTPGGVVFSRARYLAAIAAEPFYTAWEIGPMQVRISAAMALLRYQARLSFPSGKVVDCWHTDSYELRGDQWQAVWSQATLLPDPKLP